jgi:hypothetical protein
MYVPEDHVPKHINAKVGYVKKELVVNYRVLHLNAQEMLARMIMNVPRENALTNSVVV